MVRAVILHLDEEARDGPMNMAVDEALARYSEVPAVRFYRWKSPALSIGYFQPLKEAVAQAENRQIVRRWTGGGMVFHGEDRTFSIAGPRATEIGSMTPADAYAAIHERVIRALGMRDLRLAACEETLSGPACFQSPALHDVLLRSQKIVGGAQRRTRRGFLYQGSIQGVETPEKLPARLAEEFGDAVKVLPLPENILAEACQLAEERYGRREWLTKF